MILKRILLSFFIVTLFSDTLFAQIALPPFNPLKTSESAAAAGWRTATTVGISSVDAEGAVRDADSEVGTIKIGEDIPSMIGTYNRENWIIEAVAITNVKQEIARALPVNELKDVLEIGRMNFNIAYLFEDSFTIGVQYSDSDLYREAITVDSSGSELSRNKSGARNSSFLGSVSFKMGQMFYLGGFMGNITSIPVGNAVTNDWFDTGYGVAMLTGQPGGFQFRLEFDQIDSPYSYKPAANGLAPNTHLKIKTSLYAAEMKYGRICFSYSSRTTSSSDGTNTINNVDSEISAAWVPDMGFTLSIAQVSRHREQYDYEMINSDADGYSLRVGWVF